MWRGIFYNVRNPQLPSPPPRTVTDLWSVLGKKIRKVRWLNDFITRSCSWKKFSCKWSHIKHLSSTSKSKRIPKYCTPTAASPRPLESTLKFHIFQWSPPPSLLWQRDHTIWTKLNFHCMGMLTYYPCKIYCSEYFFILYFLCRTWHPPWPWGGGGVIDYLYSVVDLCTCCTML